MNASRYDDPLIEKMIYTIETENKKPTKLTVKYTKKDPKTAISLKEDPYKDPNSNITKTQKTPQDLKQLSNQNNQNANPLFKDE